MQFRLKKVFILIRKKCNYFGRIYVALLVIDILLSIIFFPNANYFFYIFFFLSIRYVFLLEIKIAVIIGMITSIVSIIFIFNSRILIILIIVVNIRMIVLYLKPNAEEEAIVKRKIIEFGGKIARLKVKDISEKSNVDTSTVFRVLKEMIRNQEIYAEYFKSSKTVAFNQIANLENIDSLMKLYEDWEHQKLKKV